MHSCVGAMSAGVQVSGETGSESKCSVLVMADGLIE